MNRQRSGCQKHEIKNVFRDTYHSPACTYTWLGGWLTHRGKGWCTSFPWRHACRRNNISRRIFRKMSPLWIISRYCTLPIENEFEDGCRKGTGGIPSKSHLRNELWPFISKFPHPLDAHIHSTFRLAWNVRVGAKC